MSCEYCLFGVTSVSVLCLVSYFFLICWSFGGMCRGVKHLPHCSCRRYFFPRFTTFLTCYTLALANLKNAKNERLLCRVFILSSLRRASRHFLPTVTCRFATSFFAPYRSCFAEEYSRISFFKKIGFSDVVNYT